jgi:hypothetical protein
MKKQALFLLAGGLLTFAACTNEQAPAGGFTQEQVDSAVNARVAELQAAMQASNDSAINALAQWKADSMIAAAKGQKTSTPKPTTKTNTPATTTTPPPPPKPTQPSVGDRKSSEDAKKDASVSDRKSSEQKQKEASVGDRKSKQN